MKSKPLKVVHSKFMKIKNRMKKDGIKISPALIDYNGGVTFIPDFL